MQNLTLAVKIANLSSVNPLAGKAVQMLDEAKNAEDVLKVLDWIDSSASEGP